MFETLRQDFRYALRQLAKTPALTTVTVLILALGVGANTAIFSMVNAVLLQPLPYGYGERLVLVHQQMPEAGIDSFPFSALEVADYRTQSQALEEVAEYHSMWFTLLGGDEPQRVQTGVVSANFFEALGVDVLQGRSFVPGDAEPGAEPVLLLSHGYWQREFGGASGVVGRTFEMNGKIHTVVGVLPPLPAYPDDNAVFMTTSACPFRSGPASTNRNARMMQVIGRLGSESSLDRARTDVALVADRLLAEYPETYDDGEGYSATVEPLGEVLIGEARKTLLVLLGTVGLVLLIACANLANLAVNRLVHREKELAVRTAMGANRGRLVRLLLTESTVVALLGGALGLILASGVLDLLVAFAGRFTLRAEEISIDLWVLLFTLGVSILSGLAIGLVPAFYSRRDLTAGLKEGTGRAVGGGVRFTRLRGSLLVAELAVSFVLLIGAGLMVRSLVELRQVDAGFESDNVLTFQVSLNWSKYSSPAKVGAFSTRLLEEAGGLPGVAAVAVSGSFPLNDVASISADVEIEGESYGGDRPRPRAELRVASPDYFDVLGIALLNGRNFSTTDDSTAPPVALVNRSMSRQNWGDEDPVGKRVSINRGKTWHTIVGVVEDVRHHGLDRAASAELYLAFLQSPNFEMNLLVKTEGDPIRLLAPIRETIRAIDPDQPLTRIATMDHLRRRALASPRLTMILLSLFAGLALVISAVGLGGVIAYSVSRQTREIGVRLALGAGRGQILWSVMRGPMVLVATGLALGVVGAGLLTRLMAGLLYGVEPTDFVTFLAVSILLAAVAALACLVPARRATLVDPVRALHCE